MSGEFSSIAEVEKKYGIGVFRERKDLDPREEHSFVRDCYIVYEGDAYQSNGGYTHFIHSERPEMKEYEGYLVLGVRPQEQGYGELRDLPLFTAVIEGDESIVEDIRPEEICRIAMSEEQLNNDAEAFEAYKTRLIEYNILDEDVTDADVYVNRQRVYSTTFDASCVTFDVETRNWGTFSRFFMSAQLSDEAIDLLCDEENEDGIVEPEWLSQVEPDDLHDESFDMELVEQFLMYGFKYKRINDYSYIFYNDTYCVVANSYALNGDVAVAAISFDARDINVEALTMKYQNYYYSGCRAVKDFFSGGVFPARVSGGLCGHSYTFGELRDFFAEC